MNPLSIFTIEKIEKRLKAIREAVSREVHPIPVFRFLEGEAALKCHGAERMEFDDRFWLEFRVGETWGGYDVTAWFRAWLPIPEHLRDKKLGLRFLVGPRDGGGSTAESLLYVNGLPLQGIDVWHEQAWLPPEIASQECILVALKAWSGVLEVPDWRRFKLAQLVWIDDAAESFYAQAVDVHRSITLLPEGDLRRIRMLQALNAAFVRIDFSRPCSAEFYRSVSEAGEELRAAVDVLEAVQEIKPKVVGIGHAHIDMAWLWRLRHSREKASRTFSTALHLMRQYPEYRFLHSSPQLYQFLKEDYPDIYARVKEKIAVGQWEVNGGMWVEADTNLTGGESLVRQFLFGKRFVEDEFGVSMDTLWLPDVFGFSWALPQIVKKSGLKNFLTSKISWSQFNRFPYDTFRWRGIDGTELLTHFVTTPEDGSHRTTYNGQLTPAEVKGAWDQYQQKDANSELLMLYGWGDGGGGPTKEMLDSARCLKNLPGIPQVELDTASAFFERLDATVIGQDLPVWDGELYLEYHRGTYTSQAAIKRLNRQAEVLYHNAEWLSALADVLTGEDAYPVEALREGWERILLNQFHDILPGSSIRQVYEDAREDYALAFASGERAVQGAIEKILAELCLEGPSLVALNSLSWERDGLIEVPLSDQVEKQMVVVNGQPAEVQMVGEGEAKKLLVEARQVPALGYQAYPIREAPAGRGTSAGEARAEASIGLSPPSGDGNGQVLWDLVRGGRLGWWPSRQETAAAEDLTITPGLLENSYYRIELDGAGQIVSLLDKRLGREVLSQGGRGNVFQVFEDKPLDFDAWDIDIFYQEKSFEIDELVEAVVEEAGPLRGSLRQTWRFRDSTVTQRITLYRRSPRIDFRTEVDWHERQTLLKVAFPVAVRASRATYEIQFGNIERPNHWNTSWDYARFETVGHRWVDLSEGDYGVALLNDCKYGYDVRDNVLRLTLIKSAVDPDPTADQGLHFFTYSLLPHAGDWRLGRVSEAAYELNYPLLAGLAATGRSDGKPGGRLPDRFTFASLEADNVILETVKKAEKEEAWVVRLYEYRQCRRAVTLKFARLIRMAVECNLMEEEDRPVEHWENVLHFDISPYEIKTFKVWF